MDGVKGATKDAKSQVNISGTRYCGMVGVNGWCRLRVSLGTGMVRRRQNGSPGLLEQAWNKSDRNRTFFEIDVVNDVGNGWQ